MADNWFTRLRHSLLQLNLYNNAASTPETVHRERLSTLIHLVSLIVLLLTSIIITGSIVRTTYKIDYLPSQSKFERLLEEYPDTLKCPCSRLSILYERFVTAHVKFHQICSSEFVRQSWIDSVYIQNNISLLSSTDDIRSTLSAFWQTISSFCYLSNQSWSEALLAFDASTLLTPTVIKKELVQIKAQSALHFSLTTIRATLSRSLLAIQRTTIGNEFVSGLSTNFYTHFTTFPLDYPTNITISPRRFNDCLCSNINGCPHPSVVKNSEGEFLIIPGIVIDCLIVDGTLASTLECYYNRTCISNLHQQISPNMNPLLTSLNKHFSSKSTIQELLNELMIDELSIEIAFDSFYDQCKPTYCSYTYSHRFDIFYIITTIIGIFNILSFVLHLIAPFILEVIFYFKNRFTLNNINHIYLQRRQLPNIFHHLRLVPNVLRQKLVSLNLFEGRGPHTPESVHRERITTRLFIFLLAVTTSGFGFYTFLSIQTQIVTVPYPSLDTYLSLYLDSQHSTSLECPCSQLSVPYEKFLNVTFVLHQVCSSEFISSTWLNYVALFDPALQDMSQGRFAFDFRVIATSYFQFLAIFCSLATTTIEDALHTFTTTEFVNGHLLSPSVFAQESQSLIDSFINSTSNDFKRTLRWINIAAQANQLVTGTNINSYVTIDSNDNVNIVDSVWYYIGKVTETEIYADDICICAREGQTCSLVSAIYFNTSDCSPCNHFFIGMTVGCVPLFGFLKSTITWLYNSTYVEQIRSTYAMVIPSKYSSPLVKPLNASVQTRFVDGQLSELINEMLLETWLTNNSHFDRFYNECAPISCSYVIQERHSIIAAILLLIAICGGLNSALSIFVPITVKLIFLAIKECRNSIQIHERSLIGIRVRTLRRKISKTILTLNLFKSNSVDVATEYNERVFTRVYLVLLTSIVATIILYTSIIERTMKKIRTSPSYVDYEQLLILYPDSLQCPCSQISIPYSAFVTELSVESFHPVCTSDFLSIHWMAYLQTRDESLTWLNQNDFRYWGYAFFQLIQLFCSLAQDNVDNSLLTFGSSSLITDHAISRVEFNNQMNTTLHSIQTSIPIAFTRTLDLIRTTTQSNALINVFSWNWKLALNTNDKSENASLLSIPVSYDNINENITCSCATSRSCSKVAQMFYHNSTVYYSIEGLRVGCFQVESLLLSSLSCFYSNSCIEALIEAMPLTDERSESVWGYRWFDLNPLDASSSRFAPNETLERIAQSMFIDSWTSNVSYELFFNSCAPNQCTFTYQYRFDILDVLSTFLSVFGGLSLGLRFFVPHLVRRIIKIRNRFRVAPLRQFSSSN